MTTHHIFNKLVVTAVKTPAGIPACALALATGPQAVPIMIHDLD
jgi:hypothetical protein